MSQLDILLRDVVSGPEGNTYQDTELRVEKLRIGHSQAANIQLCGENIAALHVTLELKNGQLEFQCKKKSTIQVNGATLSKGVLQSEDEISLETHRVRVIAPPSGFSAAFEVYVDQDRQNRGLESTYTTNIEGAGWGLRGPSYILSALILCAGLLWPLVSHFSNVPEDIERGGFHGDKYWSTGPLIQAHRMSLGDNCSACHQAPFQQVTDEACEQCHSVKDHIGEHFATVINEDGACQSCHKEHNEPQSIIATANSLCTSCHSELISGDLPEGHIDVSMGEQGAQQSQKIQKATGFSLSAHPVFKLSFLTTKSTEEETTEAIEWVPIMMEPSEDVKETSHLKFDHQVHLDPEKMRMTEYSDGMDCVNCHELTADNEHFAPIGMEKHCASCHQLKFDTDNLDRELPHGKPKEVLLMLEEHYVRKFTDPNYNAAPRERRRRLGGQTESCTKGFACGIEKAEKEARAQFTQGVCNYCHTVVENESDNMHERWFVMPVNINSDWYPGARFNHVSHLTQHEDETEACLSCHHADQSEESSDVLIPGIDNCVDCHGDVGEKEKIVLPCISCHVFHPKPSMSSLEAITP